MDDDAATGKGLAEEYENLRRCAVSDRVGMVRRGLSVLLGSGMASWISVCKKIPRPKTVLPRAADSRLQEMPGQQWSQIISLLADVAMRRFAETTP